VIPFLQSELSPSRPLLYFRYGPANLQSRHSTLNPSSRHPMHPWHGIEQSKYFRFTHNICKSRGGGKCVELRSSYDLRPSPLASCNILERRNILPNSTRSIAFPKVAVRARSASPAAAGLERKTVVPKVAQESLRSYVSYPQGGLRFQNYLRIRGWQTIYLIDFRSHTSDEL
jgi:hypothetical protein